MKGKRVPRVRLSYGVSFLSTCLILVLGVGCGEDSNPEAPDLKHCAADTIPPAAVTDLILKSPTTNSLVPVWTAPGDDGSTGTAYAYDIRYSSSPITEQTWGLATKLSDVPPPKAAGQLEALPVLGLEAATNYYFALKTMDEISNQSGLSNSALGTTAQEHESPSDVADLVAVAISNTSFRLTWTAPGDDGMSGTAHGYDIRYSTKEITDQDWATATQVSGAPPPKPGGQIQVFDVTGLESGKSYTFALKTVDDVPMWSGISNVAPGLAYDAFLWIYPDKILVGESMTIVYRSSGIEPLMLGFSPNQQEVCGTVPLKTLVEGIYPAGIYALTYDFYNNATGGYYESYFPYYIRLCWGEEMKGKITVRIGG